MASFKETVECVCGERLQVPRNIRVPWHKVPGTNRTCEGSGKPCESWEAIDPNRPKKQAVKIGSLTLSCPACEDGTGLRNTPEGSAYPVVCSYCGVAGPLTDFLVSTPVAPKPTPAPRPKAKPVHISRVHRAPRPESARSRFDENKKKPEDERAEQFVATGLLSESEYEAIRRLADGYAREAFKNRTRAQTLVYQRYAYNPMLDTFKAYVERLLPQARSMARNADAGEDCAAAIYFDVMEALAHADKVKFRREDMAEVGL